MTVQESTVEKVRHLPDPLAQQVSDYVDFLLTRADGSRWEAWKGFAESLELAEEGMGDYRYNLEQYEEMLATGLVAW